jgi:hypothetical protein
MTVKTPVRDENSQDFKQSARNFRLAVTGAAA